MAFGPAARRMALTAHVTASVGWLGAVAAFVVLAAFGLASGDPEAARGSYLAMSPLAWYAILPLCLASLATGVLQGLGTTWGLFRHYWVVAKLGINVLSTLILLVHLEPIDRVAGLARLGPFAHGDEVPLRVQMLVASGLAVAALVVATALSVYKPPGLTPYGWRKSRDGRP